MLVMPSGKKSPSSSFDYYQVHVDYRGVAPVFYVDADGFMCSVNLKGATEITIPSIVKDMQIGAFAESDALTSVIVPSSVTNIAMGAFRACTNLVGVTISEGVKTIGDSAFMGCTSLKDVAIPNGVTSVGDFAFWHCAALESITIPKGAGIGAFAFYGCDSMTSVNIAGEVTRKKSFARMVLRATSSNPDATSVGSYAFFGCANLNSATIGSTVEEIGGGAFAGCAKLDSITVEDGNEHYKTVDGMLFSKDGTTLISGAGSTAAVTVPDSVTTISEGAFSGFTTLNSVTLQTGVTTIGEAAFSNATAFATIAIPASVTSIGANAFYGTSLAKVYVSVGDKTRVQGLVSGTGYDISGVAFYEPGEEPPAVAPSIEGDSAATVTGDETSGYTITPSTTEGTVEVTIPQGLDAAKVTVEVPPTATVKPNGANVAVVKTANETTYDITEFLDIPAPNASGVVDLSAATVKQSVADEILDPDEDGVDIDLADTDEPSITTAATKPGLVYTLIEGTSLDNMAPGVGEGKTKVGDGASWTPTISVKGGTSGFYSIRVEK